VSRLQKYVNGFAHCLMLCNGNEQSPAYPRLLVLLAETRALKLTFCMLRPVRPVQHMCCTLRILACKECLTVRVMQPCSCSAEQSSARTSALNCSVMLTLFPADLSHRSPRNTHEARAAQRQQSTAAFNECSHIALRRHMCCRTC
jgi:hypothetical protein